MRPELKLAEQDFESLYTIAQQRALCYRAMSGDDKKTAAARFAGVTDRTIYNWLDDRNFSRDWDNAIEWVKREVRAKRAFAEQLSLETLVDVQTNPESSSTDRINAAKGALTAVQRSREHDEVNKPLAMAELMKQYMAEGMKQYGGYLSPALATAETVALEDDHDPLAS